MLRAAAAAVAHTAEPDVARVVAAATVAVHTAPAAGARTAVEPKERRRLHRSYARRDCLDSNRTTFSRSLQR